MSAGSNIASTLYSVLQPVRDDVELQHAHRSQDQRTVGHHRFRKNWVAPSSLSSCQALLQLLELQRIAQARALGKVPVRSWEYR
jgi:hypothetical protein